jgi:diguanylate cyclase (GGDEF)-like protein
MKSKRASPPTVTVAIAATLAVAAIAFSVMSEPGSAFDVAPSLPWPVAAGGLAALFFGAEFALIHVEFRLQAYSYALAGIPLALGLAVCDVRVVVGARVVGSLLAFIVQRPTKVKIAYNTAAYAFEAAAAGFAIHRVSSHPQALTLPHVVRFYIVMALLDVAMTGLVLVIIRLYQGTMTRKTIIDVATPVIPFSLASSAVAFAVLLLTRFGSVGYCLLGLLLACGALGYRSYQKLHRRHEALSFVQSFIEDSATPALGRSASEEMLARVRTLMNAAATELMLYEPTGITQLAAADDGVVTAAPPTDDWLLSRVRALGEPVLVSRRARDKGMQSWLSARGCKEALIVPVRSAAVSGTLVVSDRLGETTGFTKEDLTLLQALAGHLAVSLQNARLLDRLRYEATHDTLTGLANRALLQATLRETADDESAVEIAVLLIDLDQFKEVNDALGHHVGDELLKVVSQRLVDAAPPSALVARLGGDEFAVLMRPQPDLLDGAVRVARQMIVAVSEPARVGDTYVATQASIGVAVSGTTSEHADLLRNADTAMYAAKSQPTGVVVYTAELDRGRVERLALSADLQAALRGDQLVVHYQPKIDLSSKQVTGVEALVRWNHPHLGLLGPDAFIPLAESSGMIEQITPLVLRMALRQCRAWLDDGLDLTVAVNLSAKTVSNPSLPEMVGLALADAGLTPDHLVLEITESSVMGDPDRTLPVLRRLAANGVALSLDDFGTGYSSLSYLQRFPVREVKIDRSFVRGLADPAGAHTAEALIRSIIGLGDSLRLNIVAEGVEDAATLLKLQQYGCDVAQGYFIGRPAPADELRIAAANERSRGWPRAVGE